MILAEFGDNLVMVVASIIALVVIGLIMLIVRCYRKVGQGEAIIRNGVGGTRVSMSGMVVWPIIHRAEYMDISVKRIEIDRGGNAQGLVCRDNLRADIKVVFFVRVNPKEDDVKRIAQSLGCAGQRPPGPGGALRRQVLRSPQDGRQAIRLLRPLHRAHPVRAGDPPGHRDGPQRLPARGRGHRLPGADRQEAAQPRQHPRRRGHQEDHDAHG